MMAKRLTLIALLIAAPILLAAVTSPGTTVNVEWSPIAGPAGAPVAPVDGLPSPQGLTAHEWGTFTSVAGPDGNAINWLPAGGPSDLPCFVALTDPSNVKGGRGPATSLGGRAGEGKIRMETPVIYFYSPKKEEIVNVKVSFPHGLITEWYPTLATVGPNNPWQAIKDLASTTGSIEWENVRITPGGTKSYPMEPGQSHYYAARRTESAPLQVGMQHEKFLFYRGIASFDPPIAAQVTKDGKISVTNLGTEVVPSIVLFENRGGKIGYRVVRDFANQTSIELPELNSDFASLQHSLEGILQAQGMYPQEASAMVDTWKDTWFEQGTRVFYIVPSKTVDAILPLTITPRPKSVARAFVGRMEVITPATQNEVRAAIKTDNRAVMASYGRFLEPIMSYFMGDSIETTERAQALKTLASIRAEYVAAVSACNKGNSW